MAKSLDALVAPTDAELIDQLNALTVRRVVGARPRGPEFLPVEVLLCLAASLVVDSQKYGSANADQAPPVVAQLARLFQRSPQSILAKMQNLNGGLSHGGRFEREAAQKLLSRNARAMLILYGRILANARFVGITSRKLPDFLSRVRKIRTDLE